MRGNENMKKTIITTVFPIVIGVCCALQAFTGGFSPTLLTEFDLDSLGGQCYATPDPYDAFCYEFGGSTCSDYPLNECVKSTGPQGNTIYKCNRYYLQIKEVESFPSYQIGVEKGKTQPLSTKFFCAKRQNCLFGEGKCTEKTNAMEGKIVWVCTSDGSPFLTDEVTSYYAGGSDCG